MNPLSQSKYNTLIMRSKKVFKTLILMRSMNVLITARSLTRYKIILNGSNNQVWYIQKRLMNTGSKVVKEVAKHTPPVTPTIPKTPVVPPKSEGSNQNISSSSKVQSKSPAPETENVSAIWKTHQEGQKALIAPSLHDTYAKKINRFNSLEEEGIIEYGKNGETKLTKEGHELYRQKQPKLQLKKDLEKTEVDSYVSPKATLTFEEQQKTDVKFVSGTLNVNQETELLTPAQSHLVVGIEDQDQSTVIAFTLLTSDKGMQAGIASLSSTTILSETQLLSGKNIEQCTRPFYPPICVKKEDFIENDAATDYVNDKDLKEKLKDLKENMDRYSPVPYNPTGVTMDDLEEISELKSLLTQTNTAEKHIENTDSILLPIPIHEEVD